MRIKLGDWFLTETSKNQMRVLSAAIIVCLYVYYTQFVQPSVDGILFGSVIGAAVFVLTGKKLPGSEEPTLQETPQPAQSVISTEDVVLVSTRDYSDPDGASQDPSVGR